MPSSAASPMPGETITCYVERDGITLVLGQSLDAAPVLSKRRVLFSQICTALGGGWPLNLVYSSVAGSAALDLQIRDDLVAELPQTPPNIAKVLDQTAIDAILELGDTPESRTIDRSLREHGRLARLIGEVNALLERQEADGYIERRLTFGEIRVGLSGKNSAQDRATSLLGLLPAGDPERIPRVRGHHDHAPLLAAPTPTDRHNLTALLTDIIRGLDDEFEALVHTINDQIEHVFFERAAYGRAAVEPRHRDAYDRALAKLKNNERRTLFLRPSLDIVGANRLTVVIRRHVVAHLARYGGWQSNLDLNIPFPDLDRLIRRRVSPLWLRILDPSNIPTWHAERLATLAAACARADATRSEGGRPEARLQDPAARNPHHDA
ncbi:MAG: hypothetical protein P4M00_25465 [Azospirillaceae bacterium]|nr:hypothetical protein [Azospirillaceae bacterium]